LTTFIENWWTSILATDGIWLAVGLIGQLLFTLRWIFQWLISEKNRRSTMPASFWYSSLIGGSLVLAYGIHKMDPVIMLSQFGVFIYARNIMLMRRRQDQVATESAESRSRPNN
jgi:lipid-A-disaccharide synthase-like uncharacterized protein